MHYRLPNSLSILFPALLCAACGGGGGGGAGFGNFKLYTAIAAGDLNGDARPDLAITSYASSDSTDPVTVLLQSPADDGVFGSGADYVVEATPVAVAIGDLNDDTRADPVVVNNGSDNISVLLQDPASPGAFQPAVDYLTGEHPEDAAIGDLNGDGFKDIAATGSYLTLLFNTPADPGNFYTGGTITVQPAFGSVAIGDLDGDGRNDLAATGNGVLNVLLQDAAPLAPGGFSDVATYTTGPQPAAVAIADLDADGKPDLAVANYGTPSDPSKANVSVLIQEHDPALRGTFQAAVNYQTGSRSEDVAIGDLNNDGLPDLAVANSGGSISVLLQSSTPGVFLPRDNLDAGTPSGVAIADLNEDGLNDLAAADGGAKVRFQNPAAPGSFLPAVLVGQ
jgi:hypothetical protein